MKCYKCGKALAKRAGCCLECDSSRHLWEPYVDRDPMQVNGSHEFPWASCAYGAIILAWLVLTVMAWRA